MKLSELIKQERFGTLNQETMLNVMVTSAWITSEVTASMAPYGVTPAQYNVLRILHGSYPKTLTCSELGRRLLDRTPDVTRLLNRLERSSLIQRKRAKHDRRVVEVGITKTGAALLARMRDDIIAVEQHVTKRLSPDEQEHLCQLLERMRTDQTL